VSPDPPPRCDTCRRPGHAPGCPAGPRPDGEAPPCQACLWPLPWGRGQWFAGRRWCGLCAGEGAHWRREPAEWAGAG
jgi:hypothetical protein